MAATRILVTHHDGSEVEVIPTLEDTLAFETTLRRNKSWGTLQESALKMQPFRAWNCLKRKGLTTLTWDEFTSGDTAALAVSVISDDELDDELEVPGLGKGTKTGASTSSSSPSPSEQINPPASGSKKSDETPKA